MIVVTLGTTDERPTVLDRAAEIPRDSDGSIRVTPDLTVKQRIRRRKRLQRQTTTSPAADSAVPSGRVSFAENTSIPARASSVSLTVTRPKKHPGKADVNETAEPNSSPLLVSHIPTPTEGVERDTGSTLGPLPYIQLQPGWPYMSPVGFPTMGSLF